MARRALITGIAGQDGAYLSELLLDSGYEVHGTDTDADALADVEALLRSRGAADRTFLRLADSSKFTELAEVVYETQPAEIYNLAAQTRVDRSFIEPLSTAHSVAIGTANLLHAVRVNNSSARIFQASSSEMYGNSPAPQNEHTAFAPISPYACAKVYAHDLAAMYRYTYGMYICSGILFNHESPRRSPDFVSRKITSGIAQILSGDTEKISLGNLSARRDWGHARDYVLAMWLMLQQERPDDYVVATGVSYTVRDFLEMAFELVGLNWRNHVVEDPSLMRPTDPPHLQGDATRARIQLNWNPAVTLDKLVLEMLQHDLAARGLGDKLLRQPSS